MSKYNAILSMIESASYDSPVSGREIAEELGIPTSKGYPIIRQAIHDMRVNGQPIGSCSRGYWMVQSTEELLITLKHLNSRIKRIREAMDNLYSMTQYWLVEDI